jgi:hypothetical protein
MARMWRRGMYRSRRESPANDFFGGGGGGAAPAPAVEPQQFRDQMAVIKNWSEANGKDARTDLLKYWGLKLPAILVSGSSALLAHFKLDDIAVIAGAVAAVCVLIDGLNPRGALRNVHKRAFNEISTLHASMAAQWRSGVLRHQNEDTLAADIIDQSESERARISAYITAAESALSDQRVDVEGQKR